MKLNHRPRRNVSEAVAQLCDAGAAAIAAAVSDGVVKAAEVVEETLRRIHAANPSLNAFTEVYDEDARARALAVDALAPAKRGKLAGVPVAVKDLTPLAGKRTTFGSLVYRDHIADYTPIYVRRLEAEGAIIIGKTNTPEFAHAGFTANRLWGVTRNPWNTGRTSGGSSGGAGAAVASGCVPLAEGTDMGGSVRIPAAFCGIVGLKPAHGRIPMDILPSGFDQISHFGPLARSVEDTTLFLRLTMGPDDADPLSLPSQDIDFHPDRGVEGLRIALSVDLGYYRVADDVRTNLEAAATALRQRGAVVEATPFAWDRTTTEMALENWAVYLAAFHGHLLEGHREDLDPENVAYFERAMKLDALAMKAFDVRRTEMWRELAGVFRSYDALICPTTSITAPPATSSDSGYGGFDDEGRYLGLEMTSPFNLIGYCPAITVPSGLDAEGLPTAIQVIGRRFDERTALRIARNVERAGLLGGVRPCEWYGADQKGNGASAEIGEQA